MKNTLKLLSLLLLLTAGAYSQTTINITTNSTDCSVDNSCAVLNVTQNNGAAMFQLTGTWTGTVSFEATSDGTNWVAINVYPLNSTTAATTATANGMYLAPASSVAGAAKVRLRASAAITGTVGGTINPSNASARVGGGGSSGSGITSINSDATAAQVIAGTTHHITVADNGTGTHTLDVGDQVALTPNLSAQCVALGVVVTTTLGSPNVITCFPPTAVNQALFCTAYSGGQCTTYTWQVTGLAAQAAYTVLANNTNGSAVPTAVPYECTATVTYTSVTGGSGTGPFGVDIASSGCALPSNSVITALKIKHSVAWAGTAVTDMTVSVGRSTSTTALDYSPAFDTFQGVTSTAFYIDGGAMEKDDGAHDLYLWFNSVGGNLSALTAGSVTVWVVWKAL